MRTLVVLAALATSVAAAGCKHERGAAAAHRIAELSVDQVDRMLAGGGCTPVDVNGPDTRDRVGVLPGAVLLTDYEDYAMSELPADHARPLVFYCANEECGASHEAAAKAIAAGYREVRVMPAGIFGWAHAGKPMDHGPSPARPL